MAIVKFFTGTKSKKKTREIAEHLEDEHTQIRLGYRPPPSQANRPEGVVDFHAVRVAYINLVRQEGGADPKEAQELARHSSIDMTHNT